jgi:hypothetical protein
VTGEKAVLRKEKIRREVVSTSIRRGWIGGGRYVLIGNQPGRLGQLNRRGSNILADGA